VYLASELSNENSKLCTNQKARNLTNDTVPSGGRAGLNEREVPGKVVTARPPKRLAQLRNISHVLVSTLQKHPQKRQNWYDLAAYTSETIGGDHVRRLVCD